MARTVSISSIAGTIKMGDASGIKARAQVRGTGMPPVNVQWFSGTGDGATARSARVLERTLDVPMKIMGADRVEILKRYSLLSRVVAYDPAGVKITLELDGVKWYLVVQRSGGGDFTWGADTDGQTVLLTTITFVAGDPYWQRQDQESKRIEPGGIGRGLLRGVGTMSGLEVSSTTALGVVQFVNTGDVDAYPVWRLTAPFSGFTLTSEGGEVLQYDGAKAVGWVEVNTDLGTIVDETNANLYAGLAAAPQFWTIPLGESNAEVLALDAVGGETQITVFWRPRSG